MDREELYREMAKQKVEMNPGERIMAYMTGRPVDFIPHGVLSPFDAFGVAFGYTRGQIIRSYEVRKDIIRRIEQEMGYASLGVSLDLRGIGEAAGSVIEYPEDRVDFVAKHVLTDYDEFLKQEPLDPRTNPFLAAKLEEAHNLMRDFPHLPMATGVAGPISTVAAIRSIELALRDSRRQPEKLHQLLDWCVESSLNWVRVFKEETGCTACAISDPVTTTDILSHKQFLEISKPYLAKLYEGIKGITGADPVIHICGHTKGIWEDLADIGMTTFSIDNCESLAEAKEAIGNRVMLMGNVPPVDVMLLGGIDDVIEAVRQCILAGADSPCGYMVNTGCQVPMGTPLENIHAFIYACRKYGANAVRGQVPQAALEA